MWGIIMHHVNAVLLKIRDPNFNPFDSPQIVNT